MNIIFGCCLLVIFQGFGVLAQKKNEPSLTERIGYRIGGFFFTLFPRVVHPNDARSIVEDRVVDFHLFNSEPDRPTGRRKQNKKKLRLLDPSRLHESVKDFDNSLPTMIIIHGFQETNEAIIIKGLTSAIGRRKRWNTVIVDWHQLSAGPWYPWALYNVQAAGKMVANFIDELARTIDSKHNQTSNDIPRNGRSPISSYFLKNLHLVGFSLGAHVAGIAGHHVTVGRVGRITGLDPAYPLVELLGPKSTRLDKSDAEFVDVIHTCSGVFGTPEIVGHADFFPNDGKATQPGCGSIPFPHICSHWRAWRFFAESLLNENSFESIPCESWEKFSNGECDHYINDANNGTAFMGLGARRTARGKYFLRTYPSPPFSMAL